MSNQHQSPNNHNSGQPNGAQNAAYYPHYSSMSALASAAHAHGQQSHNPPPSSSLAEIELYNALTDTNNVPYAHFDDAPQMGTFPDWYGQSTVNGFPEMMNEYGTPQMDASMIDARPHMPSQLHGPMIDPSMTSQSTLPVQKPSQHLPAAERRLEGTAKKSPPPPIQTIDQQMSVAPESASLSESPPRSRADFRPRTSIPTDLSGEEYGQQCILAATSSRLNPFALHPDEYSLLKHQLTRLQVTSYLNIRNGILRLWKRNPLVCVTREEALGCSKDYRWFDLADVAYDWLSRRGYINFGCVEIPAPSISSPGSQKRRKVVAVIGAGMSGLGCARQLEGLFAQYADKWSDRDEEPPRVIVLEGRKRIGGRVYSHPLAKQNDSTLPKHLRATADLGGSIITGFDNGNPLSFIVRGQLCLNYHTLKDNSVLYDVDGSAVEKDQDRRAEQLFNDILDRASVYRYRLPPKVTAEGDRDLIETGKDPTGDGGKVLSDPTFRTQNHNSLDNVDPVSAAGVDKLTGRVHTEHISLSKSTAAIAAQQMGWYMKDGIIPSQDLSLDSVAQSPTASLGGVMATAVGQYHTIAEIGAKDMRLVNWHFANLEYANATNVATLSLGSWDQDAGNEFEGEHTSIIGGYLQVPRGIASCPSKLDLHTRQTVSAVSYAHDGTGSAKIETTSGTVEADEVVITVPLGVLKEQSIAFDPPLPDWKLGAIEKLGFGLLNKVALVYETCFWDEQSDMFGSLRESSPPGSLEQSHYSSERGRFYFFWNCSRTSGLPTLVALMAGDAAHQAESLSDSVLVAEATSILERIFGASNVPEPSESIVTRWGKDKFARGSYSYVAAGARAEDYDLMARSVGNLHFAGEATCGTHPATVHGAYLSGLRAAGDVFEKLVGPIVLPLPLVPSKAKTEYTASVGSKRKAEDSAIQRARDLRDARLEAHEKALRTALFEKLGERPSKPQRSGANPFLLYQRDKWAMCKQRCDEARQKATNNPETKASRNEVRAALGQMWRDAPEEEKRPYLDETANNKQQNSQSAAEFKQRVEEWDAAAEAFRAAYLDQHPSNPSDEEQQLEAEEAVERETGRRARRSTVYAESSESDFDEQ